MKELADITKDNILIVTFNELHEYCFALYEVHVDYTSMDIDKFIYLLGYYPAIFNYISELFTYMINQVREASNTKSSNLGSYRDKRDMLERVLKSIKFQYESLSRKVTLLTPSSGRGDEPL